jgi:hypothetical protein
MYGVIFNANKDMSIKEPPVIASKKLNASPVLDDIKFETTS